MQQVSTIAAKNAEEVLPASWAGLENHIGSFSAVYKATGDTMEIYTPDSRNYNLAYYVFK